MPYTWADFNRDFIKEHFSELTPQARREILQSLPVEVHRDLLQSLSPEERKSFVQSFLVEAYRDFLLSLSPEEQMDFAQSFPPEARLAGLSAEQIQEYLEQLKANRPAAPRKPRRKR